MSKTLEELSTAASKAFKAGNFAEAGSLHAEARALVEAEGNGEFALQLGDGRIVRGVRGWQMLNVNQPPLVFHKDLILPKDAQDRLEYGYPNCERVAGGQ
jgi:hypothetical protein